MFGLIPSFNFSRQLIDLFLTQRATGGTKKNLKNAPQIPYSYPFEGSSFSHPSMQCCCASQCAAMIMEFLWRICISKTRFVTIGRRRIILLNIILQYDSNNARAWRDLLDHKNWICIDRSSSFISFSSWSFSTWPADVYKKIHML